MPRRVPRLSIVKVSKPLKQAGCAALMGEKKVKGRKRQLLVDTQGFLLGVQVHEADLHDSDSGRLLLRHLLPAFPSIRYLWADSHYSGLKQWLHQQFDITLEIVRKLTEQKGFVVLPRRWVVERSFGWLGRSRRLSKDYEHHPRSSVAFIHISSIHLLLKRLHPS